MRCTKGRTVAVVLLLLIGAGLRLAYACDLPLDYDEDRLLKEARKVSILPGEGFYFPLTGPGARHPGLFVWLLAAATGLGGDSLFAVRFFFVLLHTAGLFGLFCLVRSLFGCRAATIALALGAIDRFWIVESAKILECGAFFLTPWILYVSFRGVYSPWKGCWWILGALLAIAYLYYELTLLAVFATVFLLVATPEGRMSLRRSGPYVAAAIVLAFVLCHQGWNLTHRQGTLRYASGIMGAHSVLALSPRLDPSSCGLRL
ncbi:glycosyltransferase family 39 protein [Candidatus Sumerlaeota bacterium]|nr:glycosyltransferase family 39 protein [Candidatus Sumerlaeota bacterium]